MRAINLLPERHRPRGPSAGRHGGAHGVLAVLGVLLLVLGLYVVSANQVNSRKDQLVRAQNETRAAEAKADSLKSFGDFSTVKQTRVQSVRSLAEGRFDWERLIRELSHLLPEGVYLSAAEASAVPETSATGATPPAGAPAAPAGPVLTLTGCARRQPDVAVTLLRMKSLHRAMEVQLGESTRDSSSDTGAAGATATATATGGSPAGGAATGTAPDCEGYSFDATVSFEAAAPVGGTAAETERIPARLGGGS